MKNLEHYKLLAELFRYPQNSIFETVNEIQLMLDKNYPNAGLEFKRFSDFIANTPFNQVEEIFQKTFHIQAVCFLDLGYVIFAEDYKRGEFLVNMKAEQDKYKNDTKMISFHFYTIFITPASCSCNRSIKVDFLSTK